MNLFNDFLNTISDTEVTTTSAIFKLMLSLLLGGIVGFERKRKGQVMPVLVHLRSSLWVQRWR